MSLSVSSNFSTQTYAPVFANPTSGAAAGGAAINSDTSQLSSAGLWIMGNGPNPHVQPWPPIGNGGAPQPFPPIGNGGNPEPFPPIGNGGNPEPFPHHHHHHHHDQPWPPIGNGGAPQPYPPMGNGGGFPQSPFGPNSPGSGELNSALGLYNTISDITG